MIDDAPPHSVIDSNVSLKVKIMKEGIVVCSLIHNMSGVRGHVGASGWGLGRMTSRSFIHTNLHKLNNKLVNALLEHFWCTNKPWAYMDSQDSPWPGLGGNHHLPSYIFFVTSHGGYTQVSFFSRLPS